MTPEQLIQLEETLKFSVARQVEISVNGKIDRLNRVMEGHMADDKLTAQKLEKYILDDTTWKTLDKAWKEGAQSSIDLGKNVSGFGKVFAYILGTIAGISGLIYAIIKVVKLIRI